MVVKKRRENERANFKMKKINRQINRLSILMVNLAKPLTFKKITSKKK